jgi:enoyl-CoA hydratase
MTCWENQLKKNHFTMLRIDDVDGIHVLTLEHGKANALDTALCGKLADALDELADRAKAVVITGNGSCFCAGVDLMAIRDGGAEQVAEFLPELIRAFRALFNFPRPLVAAINGHAIAGGCVIACAADYRIMSRATGVIGMAELAVGVPLPAAAMEIVRFASRADRLQEILYLAKSVPPDQAINLGLIDAIEEPDKLLQAANKVATRMARIPTHSFELTKRRVRQRVFDDLDSQATQAYDQEVIKSWQSGTVLNAIDQFVKRTLDR